MTDDEETIHNKTFVVDRYFVIASSDLDVPQNVLRQLTRIAGLPSFSVRTDFNLRGHFD